MRLADKVALVTGGLGGLGSATARLFADEGATVIVTDLSPQSTDAGYSMLDVTDETAWHTLTGTVLSDHGRLDVLVHTAGMAVSRSRSRRTSAAPTGRRTRRPSRSAGAENRPMSPNWRCTWLPMPAST